MGTSVYFNYGGSSKEQYLIEDMVIESIKNFGIDIYYLPRASQSSIDELFGDDPVKMYNAAYPMEMYLETFNDFEGNQEFFSKFGLEIQKTARFAVARRTFEKYVPTVSRNAPKEGDLVWVPMMQKLFEIKFVEQEKNFFQAGRGGSRGGIDQLGKLYPYMYELSVELFKYNGELMQTGIVAVDTIPDKHAYGAKYILDTNGSGTYQLDEVVFQGPSLANSTAMGYVASWNKNTRELVIRNARGFWASNTFINGADSNAYWKFTTNQDTLNDSNDAIEDNSNIETEADNIIDFTELNPFGEP